MPRSRYNRYYDSWGPHIMDDEGNVVCAEEYYDNQKWVSLHSTREKWDNPYSYSEYFIFGNRQIVKEKGVQGVYSDRVHEWWYDGKKESKAFDKLWKKLVGTRYAEASAANLSKFFTVYNRILWPKENRNKKVEVVALAEGCNVSNGYPYWIIWYKTCPTTTKKRSTSPKRSNAST